MSKKNLLNLTEEIHKKMHITYIKVIQYKNRCVVKNRFYSTIIQRVLDNSVKRGKYIKRKIIGKHGRKLHCSKIWVVSIEKFLKIDKLGS